MPTRYSLAPGGVADSGQGVMYLGGFPRRGFRSADNGTTWTPFRAPTTGQDLIVSPADANLVLFEPLAIAQPGLFRSADGGASWSEVQVVPGQDAKVFPFLWDPHNASRVFAGVTPNNLQAPEAWWA